MTKVAFIDGDETSLFSDKRVNDARAETIIALKGVKPYLSEEEYEDLYKRVFYHPDNLYNPKRIAWDKEMPGAVETLKKMEDRDWQLVLLTSFPEYRRYERIDTLAHYSFPYHLVQCKDTQAYQYVKTTEWKREKVISLSRALKATKIIVVDNEQKILDAITGDPTITNHFQIKVFLSLAELTDSDIE